MTQLPPEYAEAMGAAFRSVARQSFAGQAMQGMLSAVQTWPTEANITRMAELAVIAADALVSELDKVRQP